MTVSAVEMSQLEVLASRADDKTAVAYSDVSKDELALRVGFARHSACLEFSS